MAEAYRTTAGLPAARARAALTRAEGEAFAGRLRRLLLLAFSLSAVPDHAT